jgi:hypothetical protein
MTASDQATTSLRREISPEPGKFLNGIKSMNVADRERAAGQQLLGQPDPSSFWRVASRW